MKVLVINPAGQMIVDKYFNTDPAGLDLSGNVSGVYYIRLITDYGIRIGKVVLQK